MSQHRFVLLLLLAFTYGCSSRESEEEMERQKALLESLQQQEENFEAIEAKKDELRQLESELQERLTEIEERESNLMQALGTGYKAEPSVVMPSGVRPRVSNASLKSVKNSRMSSCVGS